MRFLKRLFSKKRVEETDAQKEMSEKSATLERDKVRPVVKKQSLEDIEKNMRQLEPLALEDEEKPDHTDKSPEAVHDRMDSKKEKEERPEVSGKATYHIKKHTKGWQIIADGAERAWRIFPSQKDAIDFAKEQELDYLLYRVDGTLRK